MLTTQPVNSIHSANIVECEPKVEGIDRSMAQRVAVSVRLYRETDRNLWDSYVVNHSRGTFFHLTGWKRVVEKTFGHRAYYLVASRRSEVHNGRSGGDASSGQIVGVLPLIRVKSFLFSRALVSVPFAAYGGILADSDEVSALLLREAKKITASERLEYLELRNRDAALPGLPSIDLYVTFRRRIDPDLDVNLEAIPRKARRMIRQGEKAGLTFQFGREELIPAFYEVFARSYHRLGSPVFPMSLFVNFLEEFGESSNILLIKSREGKVVSGVLSFYYKDEVLPYYAGSLIEHRDSASNDFKYWQLMKFACGKGYRLFDFGRSKVGTGPYDFKRHWGFEPKPLAYQYALNGIAELPNFSPANPRYQRKIRIWQKLPFWATKIVGPRIVRHIP